MSERSCTLLVLGHLPSADNRAGLRSRDLAVDPTEAARWRDSINGARPLLRCFGRLIAATYSPASRRHAESARLLTAALGAADPVVDARLDNIDYGIHKGRPLAETPSMLDLDRPYDGGEAWTAVASRWRAFCDEMLPRHPGGIVLLAGQSAAAPRMLRHICGGVPLAEAVHEPVPTIPFFSSRTDFPTDSVTWRYAW